ncbi:UDP-3-O-(3-hydroxymyristoyl)glucosamine N-acyltransferase [Pseudooceanicola algae]|uniref:UDP-3-O-acylglucosamine N-acyltransferase n=1 Tax=Pseudooceanicola algae TaxID=1537215 RepID=A0A418SEF2_9RHOB|nr:UDP-3-O-(3-hydroxymyristoyl)glucosamine N-acyltransferase [Pseudooceanicola algae]QPM89746.1 UDP-3-O-acylglucosamine N-acyltransferase [Pseudooceanicola algae]
MAHSIQTIAEALGCVAVGDTSLMVDGLAEPATAGPTTLALAMKPAFAEGLAHGQARAAILWEGADWQSYGLEAAVFSPRPRLALSTLTSMLDPGPGFTPGIHPSAVVDPTAILGEGVSVGPFTLISAGARIGAGSSIGPQCHIGPDVEIGEGALMHSGVKIGRGVRIGARFRVHQNAVIGSDGFSFVTAEVSNVERMRSSLVAEVDDSEQSWIRIHSLGSVEIGDDVEVGAMTAIDSGTARATRIGSRTKIDNLCHIAHNCIIGTNCLLAAFAGVAGSTRIGNNVVFGGRAGVADNLKVGDGAIISAAAVVLQNVPAGRVVMGHPALKLDQNIAIYKALRRLPRMAQHVADLQKAVFKRSEND